MCYDLAYFTKKIEAYEKRFGVSYGESPIIPAYHANGFDHAEIPVITGHDPALLQMFSWGLIPYFIKDIQAAVKIQNSTLNARDNTLLKKPAFKGAALRRRCLVIVDAFYDHHWHNGKSYPFLIKMKNDEPFAIGGVWEKWKLENQVRYTCAIITTDPNPMMAFIHNEPKASETPRMPFIVPRSLERRWISLDLPEDEILPLIGPYPEEEMISYTVDRLRGKSYAGNVPEIMQKTEYKELSDIQGSLF
ncbi:MAG TPA: SOS response-associated peptidase [Saprospiraceae bacterium]|nr:SOS response-associated peptidase [Saprospiraceae bacterium]